MDSVEHHGFWQNQFLSEPSNDSCKETSIALASSPHVAGTPSQEETGEYVWDIFDGLPGVRPLKQEWNDTVLDHFVSSQLRVSYNESEWVTLNISERVIASDPDTDTEYASHIWSAYSANGTVSGNVVYINYGRRSDYEFLIDNGNFSDITSNESFAGKIGLVRFGRMGRSTKVKIAQQYGMVALLIFSDPEDYARDQGAVYPDGPWLPPSGVQRGSVKFASCPGNVELSRLQSLCGIDSLEEAIPSVPVMPVSYGNAERLFVMMEDGETAPDGWHGEIDGDYMISSPLLRIEVTVETDLRNNDLTRNIYGVMDGEVFPEQAVMMGAHRDSWVCGAQDDVSGTVTVLEVAKGMSALYERGWRPKRTMVFASWDSEESGLIGSTNFGEDLESFELGLDEGIIAYLKFGSLP